MRARPTSHHPAARASRAGPEIPAVHDQADPRLAALGLDAPGHGRLFAGGRHPGLLGLPVREGWPEVAGFNDRVMKMVLAGGVLSYRDQEMQYMKAMFSRS